MFLTTKPRLFCFSARSGKLELNIGIKEIANVKYVTDKSFSFEDVVVRSRQGIMSRIIRLTISAPLTGMSRCGLIR